MSDDEGDPEAQGVDALRLLKQGVQHTEGVTGKLAGSATSEARSVPIVALFPAQKRSRTPSQDFSDQAPPSGVQKVQQGNTTSTLRRPSGGSFPGQQSGAREKNIKAHKSVPDQAKALGRELRSCRSAPDLTIPALAAIRGLQDGTLQVDRQTRIKIATAARRVLEARELKRRVSQEGNAQPRYTPYPVTTQDSPPAADAHLMWEQSSRGPAFSTANQIGSNVSSASGLRPSEAPGSLTTAAAIASGQLPSQLPSHLPRAGSNAEAAMANFHRPALAAVTHSGALLSTTHRPFTITTGLPRFATAEAGASTEGGQTPPSTPTSTPATSENPSASRPHTPPASKTLCMGDLFKSDMDRKGATQ